MTITHMNDPICEQLSAWMDGELSPEETKFLERRLQHDEQLQAMFSRMQLMSACMKRQQIMPMDLKLCARVKTAIESESIVPVASAVAKKRSPIFAWAAAASVAAMAVVFAPRLWQGTAQPQPIPVMASAQTPETNAVPSFASADMVASFPQEISTGKNPTVAASTINNDDVLQDRTALRGEQSPMPLADVESPENFPLNVNAQKKTWPRSSLATGSDPVMEAYLVRHNQMMTDGGLSGFVPYVDVMAEDQSSTNHETPSNRDAEVNHQ